MTFLSPIAAVIAAAVATPLLLLLYFLKMRRRQVDVSSTMLWRKSIEDLQANAPFQRLRKNLLLLLQLLILAGLLVAMSRPAVRDAALEGKRVVFLIDHSASMAATDVRPSRLAEVRRLAGELVDAASSGGGAMVVSFAARAQVVQPFTGDASLLRQAIDAIGQTDEPSRLGPALQLIEQFGKQSGGGELTVYILSDGRVEDARGLALEGGQVRFLRVGAAEADNVAVAALSARRDYQRPERVQGYAGLVNFNPTPLHVNLTVKLDDHVARVIAVDLPAAPADGAPPVVTPVSFDFESPGAVMVEAALDRKDDLESDNRAWVQVAPSRPPRVLLVTGGNIFLERAIRAAGVKQVTVLAPDKYKLIEPSTLSRGGWGGPGTEGFDVAVFDRFSPPAAPPVNGLYFACAPPGLGVAVLPARQGEATLQAVLDWRRDAAALRYVSMDDLVLQRPGRLVLPETAEVLATGPSGPVMAQVGGATGARAIVASFDLYQTNWPLQIGFPVFVSNALGWLGSGEQGESGLRLRPGDAAVVSTAPGATHVSYQGPTTLTARAVNGSAVLPVVERVGVYRATSGVAPPWDRLAVSLTDANESDLRPVGQLAIGTRQVMAQDAAHAPVRREVYTWFLWAALAVLLVEWVVYTRRMHL